MKQVKTHQDKSGYSVSGSKATALLCCQTATGFSGCSASLIIDDEYYDDVTQPE